MMTNFDVIIVGGGPAGYTAAIYTARQKLKTLLLTQTSGGQMVYTDNIENYPGFEKISGVKLLEIFRKQLSQYSDAKIIEGQKAESLKIKDQFFKVTTDKDKYQGKTIIIAAGKVPRHLNVSGEKELENKGVSYCPTCDGPLFTNKSVAVVGGGNSAIEAVLQLSKYTQEIYLLNIGPTLSGEKIRIEKIEKDPKVKIIGNAQVQEVFGLKLLEGLRYKDTKSGQIKDLKISGMFVEIGYLPATDWLKGVVELNKWGEIIIDEKGKTSLEGVFACGDITQVPYKQIVIACGQGAIAALSASNYLQEQQ